MPNREDIAWAAGLFDGEGCLSEKLTIVNTDISLLKRFASIFPGGTWKIIKGHGMRQTRYDYVISRHQPLQHAIASMWEWLSERRKIAASNLLLKRKSSRLPYDGTVCQKGLHPMVGNNVITGGRRKNGKTFRRCKTCLADWSKHKEASAI